MRLWMILEDPPARDDRVTAGGNAGKRKKTYVPYPLDPPIPLLLAHVAESG